MKKSKFKLTHLHSATLDAGYLVPFLLQPTLPNDSFRIGLSTFLRAQPMLAPLMHEVYLNTQYWYVPYRLIWEEWEDLITGGNNLSSTPVFPTVVSTADDAKVGSLWDYLGFPLESGVEVSALPFRAIAEIWNTRYRDEDLQSEVPISYASGRDTTTSRKLLSPCISKDYFSVARPYTQRGADVFIPVTAGESSTQIIHEHSINNILYLVSSDPSVARYMFNKDSVAGNNAGYKIRYGDDPQGFLTYVSRLLKNGGADGNTASTITNILNKINADIAKFGLPSDATSVLKSVVPGTVKYTSFATQFTTSAPLQWNVSSGGYQYIANFNAVLVSEIVADKNVTEEGVITTVPLGFDRSNSSNINSSYPAGATSRNSVYGSIGGKTGTPTASTNTVIYVTLSSSGALSVRSIRESSALQRYAERSLRYGNRYEEFIQREFGISPRDSRIQRPEYLGGGRGLLNISEVLQTAESADTGVGTMRGHGIGAITQRRIKFRSPEHGLIIGFLSIRPKIVYTQGIDREFLKRSRLDFFTPELANIGMQEVLTQEIYATSSNKGSIFGYSDRYQEYRYHKPLVTGEFRGNLNFWNMALEFANQPELNAEFVNMATYAENWKRPFQVQDNSAHAFVCMLKNHIRAYRPIPKRAKDILK